MIYQTLQATIGVARTMTIGPHSLEGVMTPLLVAGTTLPAEATKRFATVEHRQTTLAFTFYRGDAPLAAENEQLGDAIHVAVPAALAGEESIDLTIRVREDGVIEVDAYVVSLDETVLRDYRVLLTT